MSEKSILYAGTSILTGRALAVVMKTGIDTEVGQIAQKVTTTEESASPLTIRMEKFSKQITIIIVVISLIIGFVLFKKGYSAMDIFLSVVALSVSAMPEGLPLALTMALSIGSNKMSKRNVIVKKLNSVESLGSCTVIASDKTGTLTVNEQTAKKILLASGEEYDIEGNGYNDNGNVIALKNAKIKNAAIIYFLPIPAIKSITTAITTNAIAVPKSGSAIINTALAITTNPIKVYLTHFFKLFILPHTKLTKTIVVTLANSLG